MASHCKVNLAVHCIFTDQDLLLQSGKILNYYYYISEAGCRIVDWFECPIVA